MEEPHPGCKQPGCREVTQGGWLMHHLCIVCGEVVCAGGCALCDDDLEQDVCGSRGSGWCARDVLWMWSVRRGDTCPSRPLRLYVGPLTPVSASRCHVR